MSQGCFEIFKFDGHAYRWKQIEQLMHMAANFFACFRFGRLIRPKHVLPWPLPLLRRSIWTCSAHVPVLHSQETPDVKHQSWVWKIRFLHNFPLGMAKHRTSDSMSFFLYLFPRCSCLFPKWGQDSSSARLRNYQFLSYLEWLSIFGGTVWNQQADCDDSAWCQQDSWWFSRQTAVSWVHISEKKLIDRHGSFQIIFQLFMMNIYVEISVIPIQSQWISFF